jgi:hypothetical protein
MTFILFLESTMRVSAKGLKAIARMVGIPWQTQRQRQAGLHRLTAAGGLTWNGGKPKFAPPLSLSSALSTELSTDGKSISKMVVEDRE